MTRALAAIAIVVCALAAPARAAFVVTTNPAETRVGEPGVPMRIVVSVRNASAQSRTLAIAKAVPLPTTCLTTITIEALGGGPATATVLPGRQAQFVIASPAAGFTTADLTTGNPSCAWTIASAGLPDEQFTTTFQVQAVKLTQLDPQPQRLSFGQQGVGGSETQTLHVVNYEATALTTTAVITGDGSMMNVAFAGGACDGEQTCTLTIPGRGVVPLQVRCAPQTDTPLAGTIDFEGPAAVRFASSLWACNDAAGSGGIAVAPMMVTAANVPIGTTSAAQPITITNTGSAALTASVLIDNPHWTVDACAAPATCTVQPGTPLTIHARLTPTAPGPDNGTLTVDSSAGMPTVMLLGSGLGARLRVDQPPPPYLLDFGTIGRNQMAVRTVELAAVGNSGLTINVGAPPAPFAASTTTLTLAPGGTGSFDVSCMAATAGGPHDATIDLGGTFYEADTTAIDVRCRIADTAVQVTPNQLAFGEVRVGTAARAIPITITNPGPPVMLQHVRLSGARDGLTLDAPGAQTLMTNVPVMAVLELAPAADVVLDGVALEIGVGGQALVFPITGRVVTPKAHVTPGVLDLGTACLGTAVTGTVLLVNDGTATLRVQPPMMDQAFTPLFLSPTTYPDDGSGAPLAPRETAMAGVTPSTSQAGTIRGTLSWDVDAPGAPFVVDVDLAYIDEGTALSPRRLAFGSRPPHTESLQQTVRLENCSAAPVTVTVAGVTRVEGGADAWIVSPRTLQTTLGPRDPLVISVRFAPKQPGPHAARIDLDVDGEQRFVELEGHATGEVPELQSFYNCGCAAGTSPWQGIPLAGAVALLLRRRRRGPAGVDPLSRDGSRWRNAHRQGSVP